MSGYEVDTTFELKRHFSDQARIAGLERQLESARSLAVDRDQRLARIEALLGNGDCVGAWLHFPEVARALRIARGEEGNA